jgi:uncharacterized membrane protein YkoI
MQQSRTLLLVTALALFAAPAWAASDMDAVAKSKLSLNDAIMAAEKASGGKAMEADITTKKDLPVWDITVLKGDSTAHYAVDASTSTAQAVEDKGLMAKVEKEGQDERKAARSASVSLKEAVSTVEKQTGGKVMTADLEADSNKAQYDFKLALDGKTVKKSVDAATGKIVAAK